MIPDCFCSHRGISTVILLVIFAMSGLVLNAQELPPASRFRDVPAAYHLHPELGHVLPAGIANDPDYELIHLRTPFSRTFRNKSGSTTTALSSTPLHYADTSGMWLSLDYRLHSDDGINYRMPVQRPVHLFNINSGATGFMGTGGSGLLFGEHRFLRQYGIAGELIPALKGALDPSRVFALPDGVVTIREVFPTVDLQHYFDPGVQKTNYILHSPSLLVSGVDRLVITEELRLPEGWSIVILNLPETGEERLKVVDELLNDMFIFHPPVVTDQQEVADREPFIRPHLFGSYEVQYNGDGHWLIGVSVDASWLLCPTRVYPVVIDPTVVVVDSGVMNSCFSPNYQQGALQLSIPTGTYVFNTYLEWDFTATTGTQAWMEDQRSYVSGPAGQTAVFSGTGNTAGTQTYTVTNSQIANGPSTGNATITFHASRVWGGSGCNATFNYIGRRYVEITYDSITFGPGQVVINEYSASNLALTDNYGRAEDWVELYNNSGYYVDLSGYHLSDNPNNPTKWQIGSGFIPPGGRVLVWCSGKDISSGTVFHAGFRLTQMKPEYILLADSSGNVLEAHQLQLTQGGHSRGRVTDGANQWGVFANPTPFQANTGAHSGYTTVPQFSHVAGHYASGQTITLTPANTNEEIRYTLNGSEPVATSPLYTQPILANQTTVIRARAFSSDTSLVPGFIGTRTFLINENHSLPVFSFAGNSDLLQLFNGNRYLRPLGSFEFFDENGAYSDASFGEFNKHGNDSWNYPQRGVDFISRDEFGYNDALRYKFFATSDRTEFQRLMVKAAANDNYPFENGGAHIRDSYIQTLSQLSNLNLDERSSTNVIVYVNGQYWGVYDLREKVDDHDYTDYYYGQSRMYAGSNLWLQFLKTWGSTQPKFGNQPAVTAWSALRQYIQNNNMGVPTHFDYVDSMLDISSLIDYFVINSFMVSRDWLNYNTGWWRGLDPTGDAGKWRYILWDQEAALGHYTNFTGMPNVTAHANPCQVEHLTVNNNGHVQSIRKLIQENPTVRQQYVTRYADLLNTHFACNRIVEVLDSMVNNIAPEMPRQLQRWNAGTMTGWQNNVQAVRTFLETRCTSLVTSLASCYNLTGPYTCLYDVSPAGAGRIRMNSEWLPVYPFQAAMYGNIQTLLMAEAAPGFVFSHWEIDSATAFPNDSLPDISLMIDRGTTMVARFINPYQSDDTLIHYWHFNHLVTPGDVLSIQADTTIIPGAVPLMTYTGIGQRDMDAVTPGSGWNLHLNEPPGTAVRVRNPSDGRALVFDLPTTNYTDIKFAWSAQRTALGMLRQIVSYTIDGIQFVQTGLDSAEFEISEEYHYFSVDFTGIPGVEHNPDFKIRIDFHGNTQNTSGNNRFDNITLKGRITDIGIERAYELPQVSLRVYPNPTHSLLHVDLRHIDGRHQYHLFDLTGRSVQTGFLIPGISILEVSSLKPGMYLLQAAGRTVRVVIVSASG
jgi:hypothetical protein